MAIEACWEKKKYNVYLLLKIDNEYRNHVGSRDYILGLVI